MKTKLVPVVLAALLVGCTTTGKLDIPRLSAAVQEAARIGTSEAVRDRPEWRPAFVIARDQLNTLGSQSALTVDMMLTVLSGLPVAELSSDGARLGFEGARLLVVVAGWSDVEIVRTEQLRPVILALANGITAGLDPTTPTLKLAKPGVKHYRARP